MDRKLLARLGALVLALCLVPGCGKPSSVSGRVTYEGENVADGTITFLPADGKGPSAGGKITDGRYTVSPITPGRKLVQIVSVKKVNFARSTEELAKMHEAEKARGNTTGLVDPADLIPANAEGNNAEVEVKQGNNPLDFALKKPAGTGGR